MLTIVNSVDTGGAVLAVLAARKKPFVLSLRAKTGVTEVAMFVLDRYEDSEVAQNDMYRYFDLIKSFKPGNESLFSTYSIHHTMQFACELYGDCAFSVVVEKLEV